MKTNFLFLCTSLFLAVSAFAQNTTNSGTTSASTESTATAKKRLSVELEEKHRPAMTGLTLEKVSSPRLPNGYRDIVNTTQREEIYKIYREYNELISLLALRVKMLEAERDHKIDAILHPEQVEKIRQGKGQLTSDKHKKEPAKSEAKTEE